MNLIFLRLHLSVPITVIAARVEERSERYSLQVVAKELRVRRRQAEPEVCVQRSIGWGLVGVIPMRGLGIGHEKALGIVVEPPPPTAASQVGRNPAISQSIAFVTAPVARSMRMLKLFRSPCARWNLLLGKDGSECWVTW